MPKQKSDENQAPIHTPVMVKEVLGYLTPARGERYLDLTAGYGGHASAAQSSAGSLEMTLVDRDSQAVAALTERFGAAAEIIHADFASASQKLSEHGRTYDMILADLGASSLHLNEASRGFSFMRSGPLDMRMDTRLAITAEHLINHSSAEELEQTISQYGEEPRARHIARAIVANRPLSSTTELAELIEKSVPRRFSRRIIHPATKTFQALRIAVNDELNQLEQSLPLWGRLLAPGGRMVVISFHSLEDRIVKRFFAQHAGPNYDADLILLTKKPIIASKDEIVSNPRARSAKLRAGRKK